MVHRSWEPAALLGVCQGHHRASARESAGADEFSVRAGVRARVSFGAAAAGALSMCLFALIQAGHMLTLPLFGGKVMCRPAG